MEDNNHIGQKSDDLTKRLRFKSLPYDTESNYDRLRDRLFVPEMPLAGNISPAWKWFAIAASFALLVVTSFHFIDLRPVELVWYETTAVPDAKTKIVLPDSSVVWLNANASLRYPRSFDTEMRKVDMSGEAFFEVRKDEKPFIVDLGRLHIKVLGTSFNVITDKSGDEVTVTLIDGKVALYDSNDPVAPEKILAPNNQAVFSGSNGEIAISSIRPEAVTSWITGIFRFDGNTLGEIAAELERAFHVKIHVENEQMKQKTFNAVFDGKETLDEILSILQISARYTMEKRRGEIYIN